MATHDKVTDDRQPDTVVVRETGPGRFQQEVISGAHRLLADEPVNVGGFDSGPDPVRALACGAGCMHVDDAAALRRSQAITSDADTSPPPTQADLRRRLCRMRNEGGDARSNRARSYARR